jgi:hypothetical protein
MATGDGWNDGYGVVDETLFFFCGGIKRVSVSWVVMSFAILPIERRNVSAYALPNESCDQTDTGCQGCCLNWPSRSGWRCRQVDTALVLTSSCIR